MTGMERIHYLFAALFAAAGVCLLVMALSPSPDSVVAAGVRADHVPTLPELPVAADDSSYAVVTERSIFVASRKLVAPTLWSANAESGLVSNQLPFTLIGVMVSGSKRLAVMKHTGSTFAVSLAVGDSIDGWKVESISDNRVTVTSGQGAQSLRLTDDKKLEP